MIERFFQNIEQWAVKRRRRRGGEARLLKALGHRFLNEEPDYAKIENQEKAYQAITWIYVAVSRIAKGVAQVPFEVYTVGADGAETVLDTHEFMKLLRKPNVDMTRLELWEATVGYLFLTGNAYWFLSGVKGGAPERIQVLRSDRMKVVPDEGGGRMVAGYVYEVMEEIPLHVDEVVHFKLFHPRNDYYGLSPIEAAAVAAESDFAQAKWNKEYFSEDKAIPQGMVVIKGTVSKGDFERFKDDWKNAYGGTNRQTAIVRAGDVDWKNISLSHKEMDFLNSRKWNKQEIFDIYDIPLGATEPSSTEANAVSGLNYFKEFTIWPVLTRLQEKIELDMLPFYSGELRGQFKDIRPVDRQLDITEAAHERSIRTFDEARKLEGLGPFVDPTGLALGALPFGVVDRASISELFPSEDGSDGDEPAGEDKDRKRPSRAADVDDNPANKPKKVRQGKAAKPERATKILLEEQEIVSVNNPDPYLEIAAELKQFEKFLKKRMAKGRAYKDVRLFEPETIPEEMFVQLHGQLLATKSLEDVEFVFDNAAYIGVV